MRGSCRGVLSGLTLLALAATTMSVPESGATTTYHVRLDTSARTGLKARLAFDFTGAQFNFLQILDFQHDGRFGQPETAGGLVTGDLVLGLNPSYFSNMSHQGPDGSDFYFTSLIVNFDSLGTTVSFAVDLSEFGFFPTLPLDELAVSVLGTTDQSLFDTADPLGANALFALDINGVPGGDLTVFAPMTFVAPDSLILHLPLLSVERTDVLASRLTFRSAYPNPSVAGVHFDFEIPGPGANVRLVIYDLSGRVVDRVFDGFRAGGRASANWSGRDRQHRRVAPGIYFAQLEAGGQVAIRKVALTH